MVISINFIYFLFLIKSKDQPKKYRILTLLFQQVIIIGFFLFVLMTSNPFNYLVPIPNEGLGLNPILQDPALAIHPPILYLGYVGTSIIFFIISCCCYTKLCFKTMGPTYQKMGFSFLDFFNHRNYAWINLGVL